MKQRIKRVSIIFCLLIVCSNLSAQTWSKSFTAGNVDANNKFLGGSEVLQLVNHKNMLFASVGYWEDANNVWYGGASNSKAWGQILRLDQPTEQWQEDHFLGVSYLRPEVLKQVVFTKDSMGNPMFSPDTVLIAAAYTTNFITSTVTVKSFTRNDAAGTWAESQIIQGGFPAGENYSIRDIEVYTDQITGIERIYATVGTKGLFAGKYNPSSPNKIDWITTPEVGPLSIRPLGIASANGSLYFSSGNKLYKRTDGASPSYSVVHNFSDLSTNINSAVGGIRGLTAISNPNNNNEAFLLMWCPNGQSKGVIYRLEPDSAGGFNRFYESKLSVLTESFLPGTSVSYLLGAYNEFYEYTDPITSDKCHLIGFEAQITGGGHPRWNGYYKGALFAKRTATMQYSLEEINGTIGANDSALVSNRCYTQSPFKNEDAIYYGGFDPNSNTATNKAWIYKKDNKPTAVNNFSGAKHGIILYPNPANDIIHLEMEIKKPTPFNIISLVGKTMKAGIIEQNKLIIDIADLPPSFYFIKIGHESLKFIKTGK